MRVKPLLLLISLLLFSAGTDARGKSEFWQDGPFFSTKENKVYSDLADFFRRGDFPRLSKAAYLGKIKAVTRLLKDGVPVDERDSFDATALMWAAYGQREEITRLLLSHGADPNATHQRGGNALFSAAYFGHLGIAKLLLIYGTRLDTKDASGDTSLTIAESRGNGEIFALLAEKHLQKTR